MITAPPTLTSARSARSALRLRTCWILLTLACVVPVDAAREPVRARHGMVVAMEATAADVGVHVLEQGGTAVDAAVAVGFALAVTHPVAGNLGGGGYMLVRLADGRTTFIDFRERAPRAASHDMYLDTNGNLTRESLEGWRSAGVPGTVRGFELALRRYGTRSWKAMIEPAIDLASQGFPISYALADSLASSRALPRDPESRRIFQKDGVFFQPGASLRQPLLARTLQRLAARGAGEFYEGETARLLVQAMQAHGGLITADDLRDYRAVEREPLQGSYKGYTVVTAPPSSSGGLALLEMLGILEGSGYETGGRGSAATIHYQAEAMRRAYADRNQYVGDPDFVTTPVARLLDRSYLARLRASIQPASATPSSAVRPGLDVPAEHHETTHYSVVDRWGNAVAVTYTLNGGYGNGITVPGLGFLLNNEMDDFASKPGSPNGFGLVQGEANAIQPGKRPLSSMAPTILLKDGAFFMSVGAPGGSRIPTAILQVILNVVDLG